MLSQKLSVKESSFDYSTEEFIKDVFNFVDKHKLEYGDKVLIRSAITKSAQYNYWLNCLTLFKILKKDEIIEKKENVVYDIFALLEEITTLDRFKKMVEHLWGSIQICGFDIRFEGTSNIDKDYLYSHNTFSEWPGLYFEISHSQKRPHPPNYPLVKYGIPCFSDGYKAIKEWFEIDFHGHNDGRLGNVMIFLPNCKAMIKDISYNDGVITIKVDGVKETINNLDCQFEMRISNKVIRKNVIFKHENNEISFKLVEEPLETYVQLVTPTGEKIDYYFENNFVHSGTIRLVKKSISKDILKKIYNGENENVEFKPFIEINDKKEREIIKTIIAFANTEGGSILIGVNDYSEIKGIPKDIVENYKKHIRKITSDKISKGVDLDFIEHSIGEHFILEIKIEEGKQKPYFDVERNLTFIRRGSTNRHPNEEELNSIFQKNV